MLSNDLAAIAMSEIVRPQILARTRKCIRDGYPVLEEWVRNHGNTRPNFHPENSQNELAMPPRGVDSTGSPPKYKVWFV